jgi:hypothetical protein
VVAVLCIDVEVACPSMAKEYLVSRTAYDMLIGAAAASVGLWVLGITVVVSYLALKGNHD